MKKIFNTLKNWFLSTTPAEARLQLHSLRQSLMRRRSKQRATNPLEIFQDGIGRIIHVRIGSWLFLSASSRCRITKVQQLACKRIVVRLDFKTADRTSAEKTIWQLYDLAGHLQARLHTANNPCVWPATNLIERKREASLLGISA